ncbi:RNA polymerase sigma factor [Brevundimonas sp.]
MSISRDRAIWLAQHVLPLEPALRAWLQTRRVADLEVDDVIQETYAILAGRASVDDVRNPRAYTFQIANNVVLTHLRHSRVVSIRAVADIEQLSIIAPEPSPETRTSDREELFRLAEMIAAMPAQVRTAFTLRRVEGLSQREVAQRMGLSENTVEKHIGKAIRLLMAQFGRGGKQPAGASLDINDEIRRVDGKPGNKSSH